MGRTYRYDGEGNSKYKKEKYLQEQKKRNKRRIEEEKKQEKRPSNWKDDNDRY